MVIKLNSNSVNGKVLSRLTTCLLLLFSAQIAFAQSYTPWAFVVTDKRQYQFGETIHLSVQQHSSDKAKYELKLMDQSGQVRWNKKLSSSNRNDHILVDKKWTGGQYRLELWKRGGKSSQEYVDGIDLRVFKSRKAAFELKLTLTKHEVYAGETIHAIVQARDWNGDPVKNCPVQFRGKFGSQILHGDAGKTNSSGFLKFEVDVPLSIVRSGFLAVGMKHRRAEEAASQFVKVKSNVKDVSIVAEAGTIVHGKAQRFAVLVRDHDGEGIESVGRVVDEEGETIEDFVTQKHGYGLFTLKTEKSKKYFVEFDRPLSFDKRIEVIGESKQSPVAEFGLHYDPKNSAVQLNGKLKNGSIHLFDWNSRKVIAHGKFIDKSVIKLRGRYCLGRVSALVTVKDRVVLRQDYFYGQCRELSSLRTGDESRKYLPGQTVQVELASIISSRHTVAISTEASPAKPGELQARWLLRDSFKTIANASDAFDVGEYKHDERLAIAIMHFSFRIPAKSKQPITLVKGKPLPIRLDSMHQFELPVIKRRPEKAADSGATVADLSRLDKLMEAASYTELRTPISAATDELRPTNVEQQFRWKGLDRRQSKAPQKQKVRGFDSRRTIYFGEAKKHRKSKTLDLRFRLNDFSSQYRIQAYTMTSLGPVHCQTAFKVDKPFAVDVQLPDVMRAGDDIILETVTQCFDNSREKIHVRVFISDELSAHGKLNWTYDPRVSSTAFPVRLRANRFSNDAEITLVATRGALSHIVRKPLKIVSPNPVLAMAVRGYGRGEQHRTIIVPENAIAQDVEVRTSVHKSVTDAAGVEMESVLRIPHGCFEQSSSSNYPNLVILTHFHKFGANPETLAKASNFARLGFEKLCTFQNADGGFSLWPNGISQEKYTAYAIMQLSLYVSLFDGQGWEQLNKGLNYLKKQKPSPALATYVQFALNDAARSHAKVQSRLRKSEAYRKIVKLSKAGKDNYSRALNLNIIDPASLTFKAGLSKLGTTLGKSKNGTIKGIGVMGSTNMELFNELTALAITAYHRAGARKKAGEMLSALLKRPTSQYGGTQSFALKIRAMTAISEVVEAKPESVYVKLNAKRILSWADSSDASYNTQTVKTIAIQPGSKLAYTFQLPEESEVAYSSRFLYRVKRVRNGKDGAFGINVRYPTGTTTSEKAVNDFLNDSIGVNITRRASKLPSGQVVASIAIPGAMKVDIEKLRDDYEDIANIELKDGALVLYWNNPEKVCSISVPVKVAVAGQFSTGSSVIYSYYHRNTENYSLSQRIKVLPAQYHTDEN